MRNTRIYADTAQSYQWSNRVKHRRWDLLNTPESRSGYVLAAWRVEIDISNATNQYRPAKIAKRGDENVYAESDSILQILRFTIRLILFQLLSRTVWNSSTCMRTWSWYIFRYSYDQRWISPNCFRVSRRISRIRRYNHREKPTHRM